MFIVDHFKFQIFRHCWNCLGQFFFFLNVIYYFVVYNKIYMLEFLSYLSSIVICLFKFEYKNVSQWILYYLINIIFIFYEYYIIILFDWWMWHFLSEIILLQLLVYKKPKIHTQRLKTVRQKRAHISKLCAHFNQGYSYN